MTGNSVCETPAEESLTWLVFAVSLSGVSQSEEFAARLHVDLRRQASAICAAAR
ncbi:putative leader peptide [Streptomyces sp. NPDC059649]|uniref:putative leader peptide n=1 Tax=Streptomyces sp. NPDC059649 TaxID=3346895 RepID=UPI00368EA9F9